MPAITKCLGRPDILTTCHDALQECLEAEFYSWAAFGHGLNDTLLGGGPGSVGGKKATLVADSTRQ